MKIPFLGSSRPRLYNSYTAACRLSMPRTAPVGLLRRALLWLQARNRQARLPRRLNLCATLPLGEKRFVSIIECDGQQFLIGGAAGSVALLTQLPAAKGSSFAPIKSERAS